VFYKYVKTPLQRFTRIETSVYFLPSSTSSPLYGNVLSTNGCVDGLSTIVAIVYTPPKNANAPAKYAAARFLVTMCAGTLSNAGSGCASPASHVSSASSGSYECDVYRPFSSVTASPIHRAFRSFVESNHPLGG
jgi:hypothetical protein